MAEDTEETWQGLARRLAVLGGALLGSPPSRWGSREVLTPAGHYDKRIWVTSGALANLLDEWEATPDRYGPRLAVWLERVAQAEQNDGAN